MLGLLVLILFFAAIWLCVWFFDPDMRQQRRYEAQLRSRAVLGDDAFYRESFGTSSIPKHIPVQLRKIYAEEFGYPVEKVRLDDDFRFIMNEWDASHLIQCIEKQFGLAISDEELERLDSSLATMVRFVASRVAEHHEQPQ